MGGFWWDIFGGWFSPVRGFDVPFYQHRRGAKHRRGKISPCSASRARAFRVLKMRRKHARAMRVRRFS